MRAFKPSFSAVPLIVLIAGLTGCDDAGEPVPDARTQRAPQPSANAPKPVGVRTAQSPKSTRPATSRPRGGRPAEPESSLPPGTDPDDVFVEGDAENAWEVIADPVQQKTFTVAAKPVEGTSLPAFRRVNPPRQISPARSVQPPSRSSTLPKGFHPVPGAEVTEEDGLPTRIVCDADGGEMVLIPAGVFPRGSHTGPENVRPEHSVYLDAYYIAVHEVTLDQYRKFLKEFDKETKSFQPSEPLNAGAGGSMPALGVTQQDALAYAKWAKCQLPSEAEWEKAARGPQGYPYPWGRERPVWPTRRAADDIGPVMSYRTDVSPYGVHDLAGNAREWTRDNYKADVYLEAGKNGETLLRNPPKSKRIHSVKRVVRGNGPDWKVWHRTGETYSHKLPDVGFRCVLKLDGAAKADSSKTARDNTPAKSPTTGGF